MIGSFQGEYRWLSNFWPARVWFGDMPFPTVEHAYQASKTNSMAERRAIQAADTPGLAKRMGRRVTSRQDWNEEMKLDMMRWFVWQKFFDHRELREKLLATGDEELVEGNTWGDTFWGVCNGVGQNHLGRLLMETRTRLREDA